MTCAGVLMRLPCAWFGMPLLALLIPLACAIPEPQPVQRSFTNAHDPSAKRMIVEGRITSGIASWPGALMPAATFGQK